MGSLSTASVSHKQLASLGHPVTPAVLRDKIKGTIDRGTLYRQKKYVILFQTCCP
jgi:hypothetical protein